MTKSPKSVFGNKVVPKKSRNVKHERKLTEGESSIGQTLIRKAGTGSEAKINFKTERSTSQVFHSPFNGFD